MTKGNIRESVKIFLGRFLRESQLCDKRKYKRKRKNANVKKSFFFRRPKLFFRYLDLDFFFKQEFLFRLWTEKSQFFRES